MFDPRTTKAAPIEQKNYTGTGTYASFPEFLAREGHGDLSAFAAIALYEQCMPYFNAVSMISEAGAQVPIRLKELSTGEFVDSHPVLDLLNKPNGDISKTEFFEQLLSFYGITGECFLTATGRITTPPLELIPVGPQMIQFGQVASQFGLLNLPKHVKINRFHGGQLSFEVQEFKDLGIRYVNNLGDSEVWHIKSFNPLRSSTTFRGLSRAQPLWYEIQQYVSGNITNLSNLKRGTRLSMAWVNTTGKPLTDDQWTRMSMLAQKYSGDQNAGGTPVLDGMDVKPIQQTNRDMQFQELQKEMFARISTAYRVPLALLLPDSMTLDNLKTASLQFYDNAVLPIFSRMLEELSRMLLPRYKDGSKYKLCYSEHDIPALADRIVNTTKGMAEINVNTIDELRAMLGDEPLPQGGDQVFRNAGLIPVGEDDPFLDNGNTEPFDDVE